MITDQENVCARASVHYYDFLCGRKTPDIPDLLWRHIDHCDHCRAEVDRLNAAVGCQADNTPLNADIAAMTANLEFHMALVGQPVDCNCAKPFLAPMADPLFEVRAATPITAHLRECHACADDLSAVRRLDLTQAQLCRLGQMLAETGDYDAALCRVAAQAIPSVAVMAYGDVDSAVLKHIRLCPDCRRMLFQNRQRLCDTLAPHHKRNGVSCEDISYRDIFDLCFACGPAQGLTPAIIAHLSSCRRCMDKLQALLHTVTQIMDRPKSGIVTCLTLADLSLMQAGSSPERGPLEAAPSKANNPQPLPTSGETKARRSILKLKPFLKPVAVAAGVLLVAMLALHGTTLKATDLSAVYARLAKVDTMYLKRIAPERSEILQEIWISANTKVFKDGAQFVVWDLDGKVKMAKNSLTGETETVLLDNAIVAKVAATLIGPMHILPFSTLSKVPQDATWYRLEETSADNAVSGTEVYEMVWMDKGLGGVPTYRKWRGYVQSDTKLPVRTEFFSRTETDTEYALQQITEIAYPDATSVQKMLEQIGS